MNAACETWNEAVDAADAFEWTMFRHLKTNLRVTFGGVASPLPEDNSDILTSRDIQQKVLDLLDEPPAR